MPLNVILVDDEQLAREELDFLLKSLPDVNIVAHGHNGLEAVQLVKEHDPDLLFLDVQMPGLDGFGVVKRLVASRQPMPAIVFATAFDGYAVKAFEVNALDYILKPYDKKRVAQVIQKAQQRARAHTPPSTTPPTQDAESLPSSDRLAALLRMLDAQAAATQQPAKIMLRTAGRMILTDPKDICFASIQDGVISVTTTTIEGEANVRTLEELLDMLDPNIFWRVHRGYLVNINHIREVVPWFKSSYQLRMDDKKQTGIPVSRSQTKRLRELFNL